MSAKQSTKYVCDSCGEAHPKWSGKCSNCGAWNTLKEFRPSSIESKSSGRVLDAQALADIQQTTGEASRLKSKLPPLDEVLGGGLVPGWVVLLAGEPGIGKSTILMQLAQQISDAHRSLYISGEESASQVASRAKRLNPESEQLQIVASTSTDDIAETIASGRYELVVIDSIQTISTSSVASNPGNAAQITQSAHILIRAAKRSNTALVLVGHVTKQGNIAGPKILEHLVDVVLNLEGDRYGGFKILRAVKNRYGSTNEIGLFDMQQNGLQPILNPSEALLKQRYISDGSVVLATLEGSRPLLVEVQALVEQTKFGYPKRTASGIDLNRLNVLIAVLNKHTKLDLSESDIYVNIVGGVRISEPAADLAVCMAIASAAKRIQLAKDSVVFGEVGLSGEIRHVPSVDKRHTEAKKMGFGQVLGPKQDKKLTNYIEATTVAEALNTALDI